MGDLVDAISLDEVADHLNLDITVGSHAVELAGFLAAADAHFARTYGPVVAVARSETLTASDGVLWLTYYPVVSVASAVSGGTTLTTGFTVTAAGKLTHPDITAGEWTVTYTSGWAALPADLRLAVLEDILGLYQPSQIGPPGAVGFLGAEQPAEQRFRPVNLWPRVDAWVASQRGTAVA